jgi:hypothetical protein
MLNILSSIILVIICSIISVLSIARGSTLAIDNSTIYNLNIIFSDNVYLHRYIDLFAYYLKYAFTVNIVTIHEPINNSDNTLYLPAVLELVKEDNEGKGFKDDGFAITIGQGPKIKIRSGTYLGLIYGLVDLLEQMGFRFYMPGPYGAVYPKIDINLKAREVVSEPAFPYRSIGDGEWSLIAYRANVNLQSLPVGYGKRIWGNFHTFDKILPEHDYFATHRSYFANHTFPLFDKKRPFQLAIGNPEVVDKVSKVLAELSHEGTYDLLTLSPSDNRMFDFSFSVEHLAELFQPSDQMISKRMLSFYNNVAVSYHRYGGTSPIRFGAYDIYTAPPEGQNLHLEEGLIPFIAHFDYCQLHRLGDPACKKNLRFIEILKKWKSLAHTFHIYEYPYKHNWLGLPWPFYMYAADNIKYYYEAGAKGYHGQFSEKNTFPNLLNYYFIGKALWNPDLDYKALKSEFFSLFYEQASPLMEKCYKVLEEQFINHAFDVSGNAREHFSQVFSSHSLQSALALARQAYRYPSSPVVQARIEMMIIWLQYSLHMKYIFDDNNRPQSANTVIHLIEEATDKNYPLIDKPLLMKYPFIHRLLSNIITDESH